MDDCAPAKPKVSRTLAIKRFFDQPYQNYPEKKLGIPEFTALTAADKKELGELCAQALDCELSD